MSSVSAKCASSVRVNSPLVRYNDNDIVASYSYDTTRVQLNESTGEASARPVSFEMKFKTSTEVPRVGAMLVGWGGNNGSTLTAGLIANKLKMKWHTNRGEQSADFIGSVTQSATMRLGTTEDGRDVYIPFKGVLPMVDPTELVIGGWDINNANLADAMVRAEVLDYDIIRQLVPKMKDLQPLPSIYYPDFIAGNQLDRANNLIPGNDKQKHVDHIRADIRKFKEDNQLDRVVILWTANTERFCDILPYHATASELLKAIERSEEEVSASTVFAVASILEGCPYINGSPQNTFVPGLIELAKIHRVPIGGDDFKTGQTKLKSVLVDYLVSAGLKPVSIVSYNHLGNNDGKNLSAPQQFRSKEISKSNVVDDMVESNRLLYAEGEKPDHTVVIKYVPYVGDSKRAMDEYTSKIFMNGHNTVVIHNTCEDSCLAAPLMLDLIILTELMTRITYKTQSMREYKSFHPVLTILSYLLKAPLVPEGAPVINALNKQRACIENIFRACVGLKPENNMYLEHKTELSQKDEITYTSTQHVR